MAPAVSHYVNSYVDFAKILALVSMRYVVTFVINFGMVLLNVVAPANVIVNLGVALVATVESSRTAYKIFLELYFDV